MTRRQVEPCQLPVTVPGFALANQKVYCVGYTPQTWEIRETDTFRVWFEGLRDSEVQLRIGVRIRRMSLGNFGDAKRVGDRVSELRIPCGSGYRVYFTRRANSVIVLLVGGDKSTQRRDIERAKELARGL